jgi:hypothetical protein
LINYDFVKTKQSKQFFYIVLQETSDGDEGEGRSRRRSTPDLLLRVQERERRRAAKKEEIRQVITKL